MLIYFSDGTLGSLLLFLLSYIAEFLEGGFWIKLGTLLSAIVAARASVRIIAPIVAIMFKWLVIGRYKEGSYRMYVGPLISSDPGSLPS
jgi:hypothetical protein